MDPYITKTKYFSKDFDTAIFSDPIRIYFSHEQEDQALEIYFRLQSRKKAWQHFLDSRGTDNYCYILLYPDHTQYENRFDHSRENFSPREMGENFLLGIKGPMLSASVDQLFENMDQTLSQPIGNRSEAFMPQAL